MVNFEVLFLVIVIIIDLMFIVFEVIFVYV